jgi:hypothetical protein
VHHLVCPLRPRLAVQPPVVQPPVVQQPVVLGDVVGVPPRAAATAPVAVTVTVAGVLVDPSVTGSTCRG